MTTPQRRRFAGTLDFLFGIDLRSLALFRVGLGFALLADLALRLPDLEAHYTDFGILPRVALIERFGPIMGLPSLHLMSGSVIGQGILFAVAAAFAFLLLVGFRTRTVAVVSWLLLISLHNRNPLVLHGGDIVLRMLLFWSLFLPLGACWSVDRALDPDRTPPPTRTFSVATAALLLQMCLIYWFATLLKTDPSWRTEGTAVFYALSIPQFVLPFGSFLRGFPLLTRYLTFATVLLEAFGPFLAFVPWRRGVLRTVAVCAFVGFHVALGACLALGLFPLICSVGWCAFLPTSFWEAARRRLVVPDAARLRVYYDGDCGFCRKMAALVGTFFCVPDAAIRPAQSDANIAAAMERETSWVVVDGAGRQHYRFAAFLPLLRSLLLTRPLAFFASRWPLAAVGDRLYRWIAAHRDAGATLLERLPYRPQNYATSPVAQAVAAFFFLYIVAWNIRTLDFARYQRYFPVRYNWLADMTRVDQAWDMFAPYPLRSGGWLVIPGRLRDGTEVDLFNGGGPVRWERPSHIASLYTSDRWRKYLVNLRYPESADYLVYYGSYLCRKWNREHTGGRQLMTFRIYSVEEVVRPDFRTEPPVRRLLWQHYCLEPQAEARCCGK